MSSTTIKVIEPKGILDGTQAEVFRDEVDTAIAEGADVVLIDLKDINFIDSSGLGILVVVLKKMRAIKKKMYICSVNEQVRMLFELTSMDQVFDVVADRTAFEEKAASFSQA